MLAAPYDWQKETPVLQGVLCEADDGTRTHDLLHGKQTLGENWVAFYAASWSEGPVTQFVTQPRALFCGRCGPRVPHLRSAGRLLLIGLTTLWPLFYLVRDVVPWFVWAAVAGGLLAYLIEDGRRTNDYPW